MYAPHLSKLAFFAAVYCVAFFEFFRVSELVQSKPGQRGITIHDISLGADGEQVTFSLQDSKGDRTQKGVTITLDPIPQHPLCPVRAMKQYLSVRPPGPESAFIHMDHTALTRYQFQAVLKKTLAHSGHPTDDYSSHSFRIGAATSAAMNGVKQELIMQLGRWGSDSFRSYVRIPQHVK